MMPAEKVVRSFRVTFEEGVATCFLDVPGEPVNTLSQEVASELRELVQALAKDSAVEAVVIASGKKDGFIAGAKIEMLKGVRSAAEAEALARAAQRGFDDLERFPKPVVAAIHGACLGGGLELALAGNLIFAAPDATFGQPEMKLGVFAPAASVLLPARIGQARAEDLLHSGRSIDAPTALAWGLANAVGEDPAALALEYFEKHLADKSAAALGYAVQAVRSEYAAAANKRLLTVERLYLDRLMKTHDAVEGLNAFLAKRQPKWEHR